MNPRDRVVEFVRLRAEQLVPRADNPRRHGKAQRTALRGALEGVGIAGALLVRRVGEGYELLDGHCRAEEAPGATWPALVLDLDDDEARALLATHDPIGAMADVDDDVLRALCEAVPDGGLRALVDNAISLDALTSDTAPEAEVSDRRVGHHVLRARLGVFAARLLKGDPIRMSRFRQWKADPVADPFLASMIRDCMKLIRAALPVLPRAGVLTTPPRGATVEGPYGAEVLAESVADLLGIEYVALLERTEPKTRRTHHPRATLGDPSFGSFVATPGAASVVLVLDDYVSSGTTMRASLEALRTAGVPSFGFAWGCA